MLKKLAKTLNINTETEQPGYQREYERINQNGQWWPLKMTAIVVCACCVCYVFVLFSRLK